MTVMTAQRHERALSDFVFVGAQRSGNDDAWAVVEEWLPAGLLDPG